jgi:hypothetical protein
MDEFVCHVLTADIKTFENRYTKDIEYKTSVRGANAS